jgi:hypothetical protein
MIKPMPLDPKIIREAQEAYRQWNEAELRDRLLTAPSRPLDEAWQQFLALWEFAWQINLKASENQQHQKVIDLERYYQRILKFEAWRKRHGSAS